MLNSKKTKQVSAHLLLSRASLLDAPDYVTNALKAWIRGLEEPGEDAHTENVGVGDLASIELSDSRRKNNA